jgi:hypothetical protein
LGLHHDIYVCGYNISKLDLSPSIILPHPLSSLRTNPTGFVLLFSNMNKKYIHHVQSHSFFPYTQTLSLVPTPKRDLLYPPVLHLFKVYIGSPGLSPLYFRPVYIML